MSTHYANGDVWIGNLDNEDQAEHIREVIDEALAGAGYEATVSITAAPYQQEG